MKIARFIIIATMLVCLAPGAAEAESKCAVTCVKNDNLIPLKNLNGINVIVPNKEKCETFTKFCKLYAPVTVSHDREEDANTIVVAITDSTKMQHKLAAKALESGKPVAIAFLCDNATAATYTSILKNNTNHACIYASGNSTEEQASCAQILFGGKATAGNTTALRLGYANPEEVGVNAAIIATVDSLVKIGLKTGAFPGCQVLMARHGKIFLNKNYGYTDPDKKHAVDDHTIYDLASVSKAAGTLPGIMLAYDRGLIALDSPASLYIPELRETDKSDITVKELLFHESGMQPSVSLYDIMIDTTSYTGNLFSKKKTKTHSIKIQNNLYGNKHARLRSDIVKTHKSAEYPLEIAKGIWGNRTTYDSIMHRIYNNQLRKDKSYAYSCLNFCLLMNIEENVTGTTHDTFVGNGIFNPIGAYHTGYRPMERFKLSQIAPTEYDALLRRQKVTGFTHDELACFSGGVQGNAGLFSNATDIAKLCQMWLNGGNYGGVQVLSPNTVSRFTTEKSPTCRRGLGFDKPDMENSENSPTCDEADASVFGHIGFTGTIFWVDPKNDMIFVFLCNRVNPTRSNAAFNELNIRPKLFKIFYDNIQD